VVLALLYLAGLGSTAHAGEAPSSDEGSLGIQLLDAPIAGRSDPRASRYIVDHLAPGTVIKRKVLIANKTDHPLDVEVYPAAATIESGEFTFGEGRAASELTSWTSISKTRLALAPGQGAPVLVTIKVPPAASIGERYAVIWAAITSRPTPSGNVTQIHRVGIRVYLDIGPGGDPLPDFAIGEIIPARDAEGDPSVNVDVANTGGRALDMTGWSTLHEGPGNTGAGPFDVGRGTTLAPGQEGTVAIRFPRELPNGPWKIEITLTNGTVEHSVTARISFPDPEETGQPATLLGLSWWVTVCAILLLVGLLVLGVLALLARRSRRSAARAGLTPPTSV
jgi:hypothetical protein